MPEESKPLGDQPADSRPNKIDQVRTEYSKIEAALSPLNADHDAGPADNRERDAAVERFALRYQHAIRAFLGNMLHDRGQVDEVWSRFAEKWLGGKLRNFESRGAGSFRRYLKQILRNEVYAYWRDIGKQAVHAQVPLDTAFEPATDEESLAEEAFQDSLRQTVFEAAMSAVRKEDPLGHAALTAIATAVARDESQPDSDAIAKILSEFSGREISSANARQLKRRAKQLFARKIIEQVGEMLETSILDEIESALIELELLPYCKNSLQALRGSNS